MNVLYVRGTRKEFILVIKQLWLQTQRGRLLCVPISSAGSLLLCITPGLESLNLQRVILFILYVHILFGLPLCLHLLLGP